MLEFAKKEYEHFLYLDFSRVSSSIKELFREELADLDQFFMELEAATRVHLPLEGGLIIFDEVQLFPKAREAIRHLVADGRHQFIEMAAKNRLALAARMKRPRLNDKVSQVAEH